MRSSTPCDVADGVRRAGGRARPTCRHGSPPGSRSSSSSPIAVLVITTSSSWARRTMPSSFTIRRGDRRARSRTPNSIGSGERRELGPGHPAAAERPPFLIRRLDRQRTYGARPPSEPRITLRSLAGGGSRRDSNQRRRRIRPRRRRFSIGVRHGVPAVGRSAARARRRALRATTVEGRRGAGPGRAGSGADRCLCARRARLEPVHAGRPVGALRAWNRIDRPRVNLVRIDGIRHTRYQTVAETLGIQPNMLLTADMFEHARRRLEALPDRSTARLALRPEADGFASVDVVVVERSGVPRTTADWTRRRRPCARHAVGRASALPGGTGQGELWSAEWGFWPNRPRVGTGVRDASRRQTSWRVARRCVLGARDASRVRNSRRSPTMQESRLHGGAHGQRLAHAAGSGIRSAAASTPGTATERRCPSAARSNDAGSGIAHHSTCTRTDWMAVGGSRGFQSVGWQLHVRSSPEPRGWVALATAGADRVSERCAARPVARRWRWTDPCAAAARAPADSRTASSRWDRPSAFGRSLTYGSAEMQRWFDRPWLAHVGMAGFVDVARAARRAAGDMSPIQVDVGAGCGCGFPEWPGALRDRWSLTAFATAPMRSPSAGSSSHIQWTGRRDFIMKQLCVFAASAIVIVLAAAHVRSAAPTVGRRQLAAGGHAIEPR